MEEENKDQILRFEASAYLQRLIGRELISNEYIAVAELVKNAYDAGATEVTIELKRETPQSLVISDNGAGMSFEEFKRFWMMPGYSEKVKGDKAAERPLLGEKGIGRFAADKLAQTLTVITKKSLEDDTLVVDFDWEEFEDRAKKMREISIKHFRRTDPELGKYRSGTRLELKELRKIWNDKDWQKLRKELQSLVTPFRPVHDFKIITKVEGWKSGEIKSPFETQLGYKYSFSLKKNGRRVRKVSRPRRIAKELKKKEKETQRKMYGTTSFGPIEGSFYYVDHPGSLKRQGFEPGINIYRDGFRVEPYGRPDDDWLEVKAKKAKRHGHAPITPSRLFGFVEITQDENPRLRDVTNREGLLDTPEFTEFRSFIKDEFNHFAEIVEEEKEKLEPAESYQAQRASEARTVSQTTFAEIASQLAHQLRQPLQVIGLETGTIEAWLNKNQLLDDNMLQAAQSIKRSVEDINGHITLMRKRAQSAKAPIVEFDVCEWMQEKLDNFKRSVEDQGVEVRLNRCQEELRVIFSREALGFVLDNFLQNALKAVTCIDNRPKEIVVLVEQTKNKACRITVQDNGCGVPEEYRNRILREAVPSQSGGTGFGLLYSRGVIKENGGTINFDNVNPFGASFYVEFENQEMPDE
jgi:signal transduction histidine kinase